MGKHQGNPKIPLEVDTESTWLNTARRSSRVSLLAQASPLSPNLEANAGRHSAQKKKRSTRLSTKPRRPNMRKSSKLGRRPMAEMMTMMRRKMIALLQAVLEVLTVQAVSAWPWYITTCLILQLQTGLGCTFFQASCSDSR